MSISIFPNAFNVRFGQNVNAPSDPQNVSDSAQKSYPIFNAPENVQLLPKDTSSQEDAVDITRKQFNRRTVFEYDYKSKEVIAKVIDAKTREEIKQIPDERLRKISESISQYNEQLKEISSTIGKIQDETPDGDVDNRV